MKISDVHTAKGLKFKLKAANSKKIFVSGDLINIKSAVHENEFLVDRYSNDSNKNRTESVLVSADYESSLYIVDLLDLEKSNENRCVFSVEGVNDDSIEVQAYTFRSLTEYQTEICIQVPAKLLEKTNTTKLYNEYVWEELGVPALFSLNYKDRKKQKSDIRFLSGKRFLWAHNTPRGIIAENESYIKNASYIVPIDVYFAPSIRFVAESEESYVNNELSKNLDEISDAASYFTKWNAYNELSKKALEQESEEFGKIKYNSVAVKSELNGTAFEFITESEFDTSILGRELSVTSGGVPEDKKANKNKDIAVGRVTKTSKRKITTYFDSPEFVDTIPDSASLALYTAGDRFIMARRDAARERMLNNQAPIRYIVPLIEKGVSHFNLDSDWGSHKAVTEELKRNFSKAATLNIEQRNAMNLAINTPDIALIQGPPGTGKTTVIRAICERFREIFEAEERAQKKMNPEHVLQSPKILISSFQNEAVDNAISNPLPGDIPAYRKTAKRTKESTKEQYAKALENWYEGVKKSVSMVVENPAVEEYVRNKNQLNDQYFSYKNSGESLKTAAKLIKEYLSYEEIKYPSQLVKDANKVIEAANNSGDSGIADPIVDRLESQILDINSFADDGAYEAKRLVSHLKMRFDLEIEEEVISKINAVCNGDFTEVDFTHYIETVNKLKNLYCSEKYSIDVNDISVVNECLMELAECFSNQYMNTFSDIENKKAIILNEFLVRLENEYEELVKKYSATTAATCQTSLDLKGRTMQKYDLVIVDEAARANPLDLFIPMSMGKKIVLVGDHKQLPHMLEPDVLNILKDDPKLKDMPELEKSLFERLFEMFSGGNRPKAISLTHQYRMHPDICDFVSEAFYDGMLKTATEADVESKSSPAEINGGKALTFVNIPLSKGVESPGQSKSRHVEAEAICKDVNHIFKFDQDATIGVITFYSAQSDLIRDELKKILNDEELSRIEIGTVDAFQGKEFDYVLLSCVRANNNKTDKSNHTVGFLEKPNRLCVAFSRAIKQLAVYGDAETLYQIPCFANLYEICESGEGGCYREY